MKTVSDVLMEIGSAHISSQQKTALARIAHKFVALRGVSPWVIYRMRCQLNDLAADYQQARHYKAQGMVNAATGILKKINPEYISDERSLDDHAVTDHAFCAAIRRLGLDIRELKSRAMEEAEAAGLIPVVRDNKIVTFLTPMVQA